MGVNEDGTCQFASVRVTCVRDPQGRYRVSYIGVFDRHPIPVITPIANTPVAINLISLEQPAPNIFTVVYGFADGNDYMHTIVSATGY